MKKSFCIFCGIIFITCFFGIYTSKSTENSTLTNSIRVYGVITDSTGVSIPNATVTFISSDDTLSTFSDDNGIYSVYLNNDPTGVKSSKPETFSLFQNYPNPFNPTTVIQYSLNEYASINLDIFSVTGQHVRSLVNSNESPGMHSVVWDGRDEAGIGVSAGIYLYRLRKGDEIQTKKMVRVDGAVNNSFLSSEVSISAKKQGIDIISDIEYIVTVEKSTMVPFYDTVLVSSDQSEMELNIMLQDRYRPYEIFFDSENYRSLFIYPGNKLGIALVGKHEEILPSECQITLISGLGDSETITLSGSTQHYLVLFGFCGWALYGDSRQGEIISSPNSPVPGNGILEVDAYADTVIAIYDISFENSISNTIPVFGSLETVVLWERTYIKWGDDWVYVKEESGEWALTIKDSFEITFVESANDEEISNFILNYNLLIQIQRDKYNYWLRINDPIHAINFILDQKDNTLIKDFWVDTADCVQ